MSYTIVQARDVQFTGRQRDRTGQSAPQAAGCARDFGKPYRNGDVAFEATGARE